MIFTLEIIKLLSVLNCSVERQQSALVLWISFQESCYAVLSFSFFGRKVKVLAQQIHFKPPFTLLSSGKAKKTPVLCTQRVVPERSTGVSYVCSKERWCMCTIQICVVMNKCGFLFFDWNCLWIICRLYTKSELQWHSRILFNNLLCIGNKWTLYT
jgi:hypothetical protein